MRGTLRAITAATAALALSTSGLTSCGEEEKKPVTLPSLTPSTATPTSTAGMTDEEQIRTIYEAYTVREPEAQDLSRTEQRKFFAQWTAEPFLSDIVEANQEQKKQHRRSYGHLVPNIRSVEIDNGVAIVDDCLDQTKYSVKDTRTGEVVSDEGTPRYWLVTRLERRDAGWRIVGNEGKTKACDG